MSRRPGLPLRLAVTATAVVSGPLVVAAAGTGTAQADSCKVMTVGYAFTAGRVIALDPDHYDIAYGGCVQFANNTAGQVTITVGAHYRQSLMGGGSTPVSAAYVGRDPGRQPVTASSGPTSASGSITVAAPPPTTPASRPSPTQSASPAAPTSRSAGGRHGGESGGAGDGSTPGPRVAATVPPSGAEVRAERRRPTPTSAPVPVLTPVVPTTVAPSTTPSPAVVAGPLEPPSGRGRGLPAAVAALLILGAGGALLRVLFDEPTSVAVDSRPTVGGAT
ncbi:MAG TPA: hypothetical protein VFT62_07800 [Mycobacteriales bacterium]|nr:hypothetical protein [Mycobacteriales bacterium]